MKKRINITIEYAVYEEAKKNIKNLSKYLETCLVRFNTKCKEVNKEKPKDKNNNSIKNNEATQEEIDELMKEIDEL